MLFSGYRCHLVDAAMLRLFSYNRPMTPERAQELFHQPLPFSSGYNRSGFHSLLVDRFQLEPGTGITCIGH